VHICVHSFCRCYTRFGTYPNYVYIKNLQKQLVNVFKEKKKRKNNTAQIGTNVRTRIFNAALLARSQFASGMSCNQPSGSRFSVVLLGPRENAESVPKFHIALHASHAAIPMVTLKKFPYPYPS
jgi:hypothetical protein